MIRVLFIPYILRWCDVKPLTVEIVLDYHIIKTESFDSLKKG